MANTNAIEKRKNEPKGIVIEMGSTTDQRIEDVIVDDKLLFYSFCIETPLMGIQVRYKIFYFLVVQILFLGGGRWMEGYDNCTYTESSIHLSLSFRSYCLRTSSC